MPRKLSDIFEWNTDLLSRALKANDAAELKRLLKKKDGGFSNVIYYFDHEKQSQEIADIMVREFTPENLPRWGFKKDAREIILGAIFRTVLLAGRADLFDTYFNAGLNFNSGKAAHHEITAILASPMDNETKAALTGRIVAKGIGQVEPHYEFLATAAENGAAAAFDVLLLATGADFRKDNEWILRHAAERGQKDMARHLVDKHGSDLSLAITTARTLGQDKVWRFLDALRQELHPEEDSTPPTIDSLAAEVKALKAQMKEMQAELTELRNPARMLDKPALKGLLKP